MKLVSSLNLRSLEPIQVIEATELKWCEVNSQSVGVAQIRLGASYKAYTENLYQARLSCMQ